MTEYEKFLERKTREYGDQFVEPWGAETFARFLHADIRIRVRTTYPSGDTEERTGTVGITSGWRPAFLLVHRSSDQGSSDVIDDRDEITAVRWNGRTYERYSSAPDRGLQRSRPARATPSDPISQAVSQENIPPEIPAPGYPSPFTHVRPVTKRPGESWMPFGDPRPASTFILKSPQDSVIVVEAQPDGALILCNRWQSAAMPAPSFHYYVTIPTTDEKRPA